MKNVLTRTPLWIALLSCVSATAVASTSTVTYSSNVEFSADDQRVVLSTTFGVLISEDAGTSYRWICAKTPGYGEGVGGYVPDFVLKDGNIFTTTYGDSQANPNSYKGLWVSEDGGCSFAPVPFSGDTSGGNSPGPLGRYSVSQIDLASNGTIWAATATVGESNNIFVSTNDGASFDAVNSWHPTARWTSLQVSQSAPDIAYITGYISDPAGTDSALLKKTVDGGATWVDLGVAAFAFGRVPSLAVLGIAKSDPNLLYARAKGDKNTTGLYRSTDGGQSWTNVLTLVGAISAFVLRGDDSVMVGTVDSCDGESVSGCVQTSKTGVQGSFRQSAMQPSLICLQERASDSTLFGCSHTFGLGVSADNGDSWQSVHEYGQIVGPLSCPGAAVQTACAQEDWPRICVQVGACEAQGDAGAGAGEELSSDDCGGCTSGDHRGGSGAVWLGLICLWYAKHRRSARSGQQ